jgi:hypothetical protein
LFVAIDQNAVLTMPKQIAWWAHSRLLPVREILQKSMSSLEEGLVKITAAILPVQDDRPSLKDCKQIMGMV